jgi:glycosyltransferase involved in cell wall biosynthesis
MRILQVIHQFPPYSSQGSEVYCFNLSRRLSKTEDVRVFHVSNRSYAWRRSLRREVFSDLRTYHCIDGGEYSRLADWPNKFLSRSFRDVLGEFRPEVVHFHNFLSLGDDLVTVARSGGTSIVYTLHDYGLICPNALLLRDDGRLCGKQHPDFFQDCCPILIRTSQRRRDAPWAARVPSLARWQLYARQQGFVVLRSCLLAATGRAIRWLGDPRHSDFERKRDFFFTHTRRIFDDVDLFLAPSDFLLHRYVSAGLPSDKIALGKYGMNHFSVEPRAERSGLRFGYIGALHPQKGIDILLEAFRGVGDGATLHVFGSAFGSPVSRSFWRRVGDRAPANVVFHGAYGNDQVRNVLASLDVIVVPSIWYENSPLTIHEAFIAGLPVITSDVGGMAELVGDGVNGIHFRTGDVADLRQKLLYVVQHPEILDRLRRGIPKVLSMEEHAEDILVRYRKLMQARRGSRS